MIMLQGTCKITPEYGLYNRLFVLLKSTGCLIQKAALSINRQLVNSQLCDGGSKKLTGTSFIFSFTSERNDFWCTQIFDSDNVCCIL